MNYSDIAVKTWSFGDWDHRLAFRNWVPKRAILSVTLLLNENQKGQLQFAPGNAEDALDRLQVLRWSGRDRVLKWASSLPREDCSETWADLKSQQDPPACPQSGLDLRLPMCSGGWRCQAVDGRTAAATVQFSALAGCVQPLLFPFIASLVIWSQFTSASDWQWYLVLWLHLYRFCFCF